MCKKLIHQSQLKSIYKAFQALLVALLLTAFESHFDAYIPFPPLTRAPQRIALLLPLQKDWQPIAHAIESGFLEANATAQQPIHVKVIDTSQDETLEKSYQEAVRWKADLLVGPLLKEDLKTLSKFKQLKIPTLTLNYLHQETAPANFYQFGLSPLDELQALMEQAQAKQQTSALLLVPDNTWGEMLLAYWTQHWESLGGKVAGVLQYSNKTTVLNYQIRQFLDFKPPNQRRNDFDVIFLGATSEMGRQINPLLAFYFASRIPIYATAAIYEANIPTYLNRDLDNIVIADAPWNIGIQNIHTALHKRFTQKSPKQFERYARYYALGVDAFVLAQKLLFLDQDNQQTIEGASGELALNENRDVIRKPLCAKIKQGIPRPLPQDVSIDR